MEHWSALYWAVRQGQLANYSFFMVLAGTILLWGFSFYKLAGFLLPAENNPAKPSPVDAKNKTEALTIAAPSARGVPKAINTVAMSETNPYAKMYSGKPSPISSPEPEPEKLPQGFVPTPRSISEPLTPSDSIPTFVVPKTEVEKTSATEEQGLVMPKPKAAAEKSDAEVVAELINLTEESGYKVYPDVMIEEIKVDYIAISHKQIMVCIVENEEADFIANEKSMNGEPPFWFSPKAKKVSPAHQLKNAIDKISELIDEVLPENHGVSIVNRLVITKAEVINYDELGPLFMENNIFITRYYQGAPEEITEYSELLISMHNNPPSESFSEFISTMIEYFSTPSPDEDKLAA